MAQKRIAAAHFSEYVFNNKHQRCDPNINIMPERNLFEEKRQKTKEKR
jgi:hypothetical protein